MVECVTVTPDLLGNYWEDPAFRPIVDESLVLWLTSDFDDAEIWTDLSGNNNHGTIVGATRETLDPLNIFGSSLAMNGIEGHINCGQDTSIIDVNNFTVLGWFYINSGDASIGRLGWFKGYLIEASNEFVKFAVGTGTNCDMAMLWSAPPVGAWHQFCAKKDEDYIYIYVDGVQKVRADSTGSVSPNSGWDILIGHNPYNGTFLNGISANICIYNRTLTDDEIAYNYTHSPVYYMVKEGIL